MTRLYIDTYGVLWYRMKGGYVYNDTVGLGLWLGGEGLRPFKEEQE